jgi:OOP family OmpA-OmpF porin
MKTNKFLTILVLYGRAKKIALLFLFCLTSVIVSAQESTDFQENPASGNTYIGLKGGLNFPSLSYSNAGIDAYKSELYYKALWGVFAELPLNRKNTFSIRPEINFITRGQHIEDKNVNYEMDAKYVDIYLPFVYTFRSKEKAHANPFILLAPAAGFATGGEIRLDGIGVDVSGANLSSFHAGLYGAVGVKFPVYSNNYSELFSIGLELGYYLGLSDTYSKKEKDGEAEALNQRYYEIQGTRKHTGFQAQVSIAVPLSLFKQKKKSPPPVVFVPEPVIEPVIPQEIIPEVVEKACYTLDEIKDLIREKKEITGKKICAINQISFEFGKSDLTRASQTYLNEIVGLMRENSVLKITVNGHTDNTGTPDYNLNLSRTRAKAVYDYLVKNGISSSRLNYQYYGLTKPIADNDTEEGRAINRRVEFEIINQ